VTVKLQTTVDLVKEDLKEIVNTLGRKHLSRRVRLQPDSFEKSAAPSREIYEILTRKYSDGPKRPGVPLKVFVTYANEQLEVAQAGADTDDMKKSKQANKQTDALVGDKAKEKAKAGVQIAMTVLKLAAKSVQNSESRGLRR